MLMTRTGKLRFISPMAMTALHVRLRSRSELQKARYSKGPWLYANSADSRD